MSQDKIRIVRLNKQQQSLIKQPIQNALVKRDGNLNFYFCIYNLDGDFKDGFYFGLLELHSNYPFAAPKLYFYTPNGRYEVNMPICTSFTNYHQQSWTSAWNVRSLIQGTISFMYSHQSSYGCKEDCIQTRKKYAQQSLTWNMNNQLFVRLFGQKVKEEIFNFQKMGIKIYDKHLLQILKKEQPKRKIKDQNQQDCIYNKKQSQKEKQEQKGENIIKNNFEQTQQKRKNLQIQRIGGIQTLNNQLEMPKPTHKKQVQRKQSPIQQQLFKKVIYISGGILLILQIIKKLK